MRTIAFDYMDMPEMTLTVRQAARLWSLDTETCRRALDELIALGFLAQDDGGQYVRRGSR